METPGGGRRVARIETNEATFYLKAYGAGNMTVLDNLVRVKM